MKLCPDEQNEYLEQVRQLLHDAMALKKQDPEVPENISAEQRQKLETRCKALINGTKRKNQEEEKVRLRLYKQRDHLFTFLDYEYVDATNNLAERQLRPAVIARKVSCGNRTQKGAETWQTNASFTIDFLRK